MNEIRKSSKVSYAPPSRLAEKKRVYTQAILQKVPHNTEGTIDITLKIGRYDILSGVETSRPKSELTLTNEELNNLISYLEKFYKPLELDAKKFISIDSETTAGLLLKFKRMVNSNEEIAAALIENDLFTDDIQAAINAIKRKKALNDFEQALSQNFVESYWQNWFTKNKWILGSEYLRILDERGIDISHIADFLVQAFDGFIDIVEIKRPNTRFWSDSQDRGNYVPSVELTKAITQCQNYLYEIELEANSAKCIERLGAKIIKPRCLLIVGRSKDWDENKTKAYRILNASYVNITILTYDHLLDRAKNILAIDIEEDDFLF